MKHLKNKLITIAHESITQEDPSHDINHALRVLKNVEKIAEKEGGNYKILYPAALFHDIVKYSPQDKRDCALESAKKTEKILFDLPQYALQDIQKVKTIILEHPFSKNITPTSIESKIIQDADKLEATGAISIMRTFCSTGQMKRPFYSQDDPFCEERKADPKQYALDLFYDRLLKIEERLHTKTAKEMAKKKAIFLRNFIKQVKYEIT